MFGQNHSDDTKTKISDAITGENHPMYGKPKPEGAGRPSQQIEVTDIKNNQKSFFCCSGSIISSHQPHQFQVQLHLQNQSE